MQRDPNKLLVVFSLQNAGPTLSKAVLGQLVDDEKLPDLDTKIYIDHPILILEGIDSQARYTANPKEYLYFSQSKCVPFTRSAMEAGPRAVGSNESLTKVYDEALKQLLARKSGLHLA